MIDTQKTLAYDQLYLCWRLPQDSAPAWHYSVEYQRKVGGAGALWGRVLSEGSSGSNGTHCSWQRLDDVGGTSAVIDKLEMDSVFVLRVRGCNKAGFGEYSEEVYLHTPPAPGKMHKYTKHTSVWTTSKYQRHITFSPAPQFIGLLNVSFLFCIFHHSFYFFDLQFTLSVIHLFFCFLVYRPLNGSLIHWWFFFHVFMYWYSLILLLYIHQCIHSLIYWFIHLPFCSFLFVHLASIHLYQLLIYLLNYLFVYMNSSFPPPFIHPTMHLFLFVRLFVHSLVHPSI